MDVRTEAAHLRRMRRQVAERWLDTPGKVIALKVLDEMIWDRSKALRLDRGD